MKSMNDIERKMVEIAINLKPCGLCGFRGSFEDEGINRTQLARLKEMATHSGQPLFMKIGGCENLTGVYDCLTVGVEEIVAPMIESSFALKKFLAMVEHEIAEDNRRGMVFGINLETALGVQQFDAMLALPNLKTLTLVNVGRVDLSDSLEICRGHINTSQRMFDICHEVFTKAKKVGLKTSMGGSIDLDALPLIQNLYYAKLLDRFETRRLVFSADAWQAGRQLIIEAIKFEFLYLASLQRFGSRIKARDGKRIAMIESRLGEEGKELVAWAKEIVAKVTQEFSVPVNG